MKDVVDIERSRKGPASGTAEWRTGVTEQLRTAKHLSRSLTVSTTQQRNEVLHQMAEALLRAERDILAANDLDLEAAIRAGETASRLDRLRLNRDRLRAIAASVQDIAGLPDPVGEIVATSDMANGLRVAQVRVPFGVIAVIYESRPNVTVDAAALALRAGSAVALRGGTVARHSNLALVAAMKHGVEAAGFDPGVLQYIDVADRDVIDQIIRAKGLVDLAIPRGGSGLIARVVEGATVPVIETGVGNCHVYVHAAANLAMAHDIAFNAKVQRPSVCNAAETLLVDAPVAGAFLPMVIPSLREAGVTVHGCPQTMAILREAGMEDAVAPATEADWETEYLDLEIAVRVVNGLEEALEHIADYGTLHSEAIVTEDPEAAERFLAAVDAAVVYHNASTRFTDGYEFGFGAEVGISTQKLHARGPMGLTALTTTKYRVTGTGQVRQ